MNHTSRYVEIEEVKKRHNLDTYSETNNNYSLLAAVINGVTNSSCHE